MNLYHLSCSEFQLWEISERSCDRQGCCMSLFYTAWATTPTNIPTFSQSLHPHHPLSHYQFGSPIFSVTSFPYFCKPREISKSLNLIPFFPQFFPNSSQLQPTVMFSAVFFTTFQSILTVTFISWVWVHMEHLYFDPDMVHLKGLFLAWNLSMKGFEYPEHLCFFSHVRWTEWELWCSHIRIRVSWYQFH